MLTRRWPVSGLTLNTGVQGELTGASGQHDRSVRSPHRGLCVGSLRTVVRAWTERNPGGEVNSQPRPRLRLGRGGSMARATAVGRSLLLGRGKAWARGRAEHVGPRVRARWRMGRWADFAEGHRTVAHLCLFMFKRKF